MSSEEFVRKHIKEIADVGLNSCYGWQSLVGIEAVSSPFYANLHHNKDFTQRSC